MVRQCVHPLGIVGLPPSNAPRLTPYVSWWWPIRQGAEVPGARNLPCNPLGFAMAAFGSVSPSTTPCARAVRNKTQAALVGQPRHFGGHRTTSTSSRPMLAPWQVGLAMRTMRRKISSAISISEVASLCRLSLCYFVRAFTNTVGIAPYAWFVQQRIVRAKRLLADTTLPLAQVALECGFSDQAHFTKAFSKAAGITPAKWRRQLYTC